MLLATRHTLRRRLALALLAAVAIAVGLVARADEATDYTLAYAMFDEGQYDLARAEFARFVLTYPDSDQADDALYLEAESERLLGRYDEAADTYRRLLNDYPHSPLGADALHGIGQAWFGSGRYDESILAFEKVTGDGVSADVRSTAGYHIAEAHYRLGNYAQALAAYEDLLATAPDAPEARAATYAKGWALFHLREYSQARETFLHFLARYDSGPESVEAGYRASECLFLAEQWPEARAAFAAFVADNLDDAGARPLVADAALRVGQCLQRVGDTDAAIAQFRQTAQLYADLDAAQEAQYWVGEVLYQAGRYGEAVPEYARLLDAYPGSPLEAQTHYSVGRARFALGAYREALQSFDAVLAVDDGELGDASTWYLGECRRLLEEYNTALIWYRRVPRTSPYADDAMFGMGASHFALGDLDSSIEAYSHLADAPGATLQRDALYHLGVAYYNAARYADAADALARFLAGGGSTPVAPADGALYWRLRSLYEQRLFADTATAARKLLRDHAASEYVAPTRFYLGESLYWQGDYADARAEYEALVAANPSGEWAERAQYHVGWTHFAAAQAAGEEDGAPEFASAIDVWRGLSDDGDGTGMFAAQALYDVGVAQLNMREHDDAIQTFLRVVSRFPDGEWADDARYRVAWAHYAQEDYEEARRVFDEFLLRHPGSELAPEAIFHKGTCHFRAARYYEAIAEYVRVSEQYPTAVLTATAQEGLGVHIREEALYQIGESYYNLGDYGEAVAAYERLQDLYPKSGLADDAQYAIATAYQLQERPEAALAAYESVAAKYPSSDLAPEALHMVGVQHFDGANFQEAIAEFQRVVTRYPDADAAPRAQYDIGRSYYRLRSHEHAVRACEKAAAHGRADEDLRASATYLAAWILRDEEHPRRDLDGAAKRLRTLVTTYPTAAESPRAYLLLAELYREQDRPDDAVRAYRDLVGEHAGTEESRAALVDLGATLLQLGRYGEALDAVAPITEAASEYTPALVVDGQLVAGDALTALLRYEDAARAYLVIALVPAYTEHSPFAALQALSKAGDAYERAARPELARKWYDTALDTYSSHAERNATWTQFLDFASGRRDALREQPDGGE
ncbi:tetratricopeptide repeat protein [Candidatus Poribacteria bacterium]|nr:tetratricopeptide repeat protein [Candidatus Poribacteria bacterium]MBT5536957.1 tetratricopeptide repeat protein [Candidatus Poribacteria bacterium]MBT5711142.1 tetratricopeptide repeat protein [Candidatus Poribacteria bacterium]MBT7097427.1 tetratricopeptide repeat protein [Candidatus Poribacteria bacterium]MBT7804100.1 tetratricopeptide repeat protein [Candidatus Poribacteria bacterium]